MSSRDPKAEPCETGAERPKAGISNSSLPRLSGSLCVALVCCITHHLKRLDSDGPRRRKRELAPQRWSEACPLGFNS